MRKIVPSLNVSAAGNAAAVNALAVGALTRIGVRSVYWPDPP